MPDSARQAASKMAEPRVVPFRGGSFAPQPRRVAPFLAFFVIVALWQGAIELGWLNAVFLPSPWSIVLSFRDLVVSGALARHLAASLSRIAAGWTLGTLCG